MSHVVVNPSVAIETRRPIVELMSLAMPTIAQMASYTVMQFTDTLMVSSLGVREPTAASNAGLFSFSMISFGTGVLLCVNTLVSQNFGQKDFKACGRYLWQGVWFAVVFSALAMLTLPMARPMFSLLGHEPELVELEKIYFQVTLSFAVFRLIATSFGQFLLAVDQPGKVLIAAFTGMLVNVFANWVLIFGHFGVPAYGLAGAAWGTNISLMTELGLLLYFASRKTTAETFGVWQWKPSWPELRTLMKIGVPSGLQIVADVLAWTLFATWIIAQFGTAAMAGNTFMFRYMHVSFMPAFGLSAAVTALVGRYIGSGQPDVAEKRAHLGFVVTAAYMTTCGLLFFVARGPLIDLFTDDPEVMRIGKMLLIVAAIYQFFDAMYIIYNGALRGAGDTFVPAVATAVLCWSMAVGGGYLMALYLPQLGTVGPWITATVYGIVLGIWMYLRFARGRWKQIRLEDESAAVKVQGFEVMPCES